MKPPTKPHEERGFDGEEASDDVDSTGEMVDMEDLSMCIAPLDVQAFYNLDIKRVDPMDLPPYARTKAMNRCGNALVPKVLLLFCFVFVLSPLNTLVTTTPCATPAAGGAAPLAPPSLLTHTHTHAHAHAPSSPHHHPTQTRYPDILPSPLTRVILPSTGHTLVHPTGNPESTYINANFVRGFGGRSAKEYIASQGPTPATVSEL
jgi:hypothetical protein